MIGADILLDRRKTWLVWGVGTRVFGVRVLEKLVIMCDRGTGSREICNHLRSGYGF
jgi:hypothetical protein